MPCCSRTAARKRMERAGEHDEDAAASAEVPSRGFVAAIAATMPAGLAAATSVKMSGYLEKRGKMLPTWKRYWFVLEGRLLLYFGSQFDYVQQLSPCRGSLNLGLASSVRPAGSAKAAMPQLEIATRSQNVLLRAKDRDTQERWLRALVEAIQLHSSNNGTGTHFRYSSASLPQPINKKKKDKVKFKETANNNESDKANTEDTPKVLKQIKENQQHNMILAELKGVGNDTLRQVKKQPHTSTKSTSSDNKDISAQLPTSSAVHRLLERRKQEMEDEENVTMIVVDPLSEGSTTDLIQPAELQSTHYEIVNETIENTGNTQSGSRDSTSVEIKNDMYLAMPATIQEENDYSTVEQLPADVDYETVEEALEKEPSLPPRPLEDTLKPPSDLKRKKSFLQRILGNKKDKKAKKVYNKKNVPLIKIDAPDEGDEDYAVYDENFATYETIDYEALLKSGEITEEPQVPESNTVHQENKKDELLGEASYVNVTQMLSTSKSQPTYSVVNKTKESISNIVPIVENETTHTVIITVQNTPNEENKPSLPSKRKSNERKEESRAISPHHNTPTNNMPLQNTNNKRKSHEEDPNDAEIHKTVINIKGEDETDSKMQEVDEINKVLRLTEMQPTRVKLDSVSSEIVESTKPMPRNVSKHRSADELDILLCQLDEITNAPLHSASVDALGPLRKQRKGSDPDYDIPRPHNIFGTLKKQDEEDVMEATRFFNEPDLYYARPLSEYLMELDRMSHVQGKRTSRASKAFQKWLEESPDLIPTVTLEEEIEDLPEDVEEKTDKMEKLDADGNTRENQCSEKSEIRATSETEEEAGPHIRDAPSVKDSQAALRRGSDVQEPSCGSDLVITNQPETNTECGGDSNMLEHEPNMETSADLSPNEEQRVNDDPAKLDAGDTEIEQNEAEIQNEANVPEVNTIADENETEEKLDFIDQVDEISKIQPEDIMEPVEIQKENNVEIPKTEDKNEEINSVGAECIESIEENKDTLDIVHATQKEEAIKEVDPDREDEISNTDQTLDSDVVHPAQKEETVKEVDHGKLHEISNTDHEDNMKPVENGQEENISEISNTDHEDNMKPVENGQEENISELLDTKEENEKINTLEAQSTKSDEENKKLLSLREENLEPNKEDASDIGCAAHKQDEGSDKIIPKIINNEDMQHEKTATIECENVVISDDIENSEINENCKFQELAANNDPPVSDVNLDETCTEQNNEEPKDVPTTVTCTPDETENEVDVGSQSIDSENNTEHTKETQNIEESSLETPEVNEVKTSAEENNETPKNNQTVENINETVNSDETAETRNSENCLDLKLHQESEINIEFEEVSAIFTNEPEIKSNLDISNNNNKNNCSSEMQEEQCGATEESGNTAASAVKLREKKIIKNDEVRLSFASTDTEIVCQEASSTFEIAPE